MIRTLRHAALLAATLLASSPAHAQGGRVEVRFPGGKLLPTGDGRGMLADAPLNAVQVAWRIEPRVAFTGTFAWARGRDLSLAASPKLDLFTTDVGLEFRTAERQRGARVRYRGFAGFGAGVQVANHRALDRDATHQVAGYAAVGGQLGVGRLGVRLEVRDYLTGLRAVLGAPGASRNDIVVLASVSLARPSR